jgi:hypothetical protein
VDCDAHMSKRLPGAGLVQEDAQNYA